MNTKVEANKSSSKTSIKDLMLWTLTAVLAIVGVIANYYFNDVAWAIRFAIGIVLAIIIIFTVLQTVIGKKLFVFAKEARIELYKVVWPTRQETVHTTLIIAGLVVLMAFILWGIDTLLLWIVNSIIA
jgi:preprotein translocase subunit SecE